MYNVYTYDKRQEDEKKQNEREAYEKYIGAVRISNGF